MVREKRVGIERVGKGKKKVKTEGPNTQEVCRLREGGVMRDGIKVAVLTMRYGIGSDRERVWEGVACLGSNTK